MKISIHKNNSFLVLNDIIYLGIKKCIQEGRGVMEAF